MFRHTNTSGLYLECSARGFKGKAGSLGDRSPAAGSRGRAPVEVWGQSPQKLRFAPRSCVQCNIIPIKPVSVHYLFYFIAFTCSEIEKTYSRPIIRLFGDDVPC